jgi:hypothetical protein
METLAQLRYGFMSCLGRLLSEIELNAVCAIRVNQHTYYAKRRLWFVAPLIALGNVYLKRLGAHAQVLSNHEWCSWETEVYRAIYNIELSTDRSGRLLIPAFPGISLAAFLDSEFYSEAQKLRAIRSAVQALCRLHSVAIQWPDGQARPLSHGDATVENVVIDHAQMSASWFDFDTIHDSLMDTAWRHADDLRAFTFSAAQRLPAETYPRVTQTILENYRSARTLDALVEAVAFRRTRPICFHLAQARITYRNRQLLDLALLNSLGCRDQF